MSLPTFRIINGLSRGLGATETHVAYMQIGTSFRNYLSSFSDSRLHVFLSIALSADEHGWADITAAQIGDHTGLDFDTIGIIISELTALSIEGHRVLLAGANGYLIFPTPDEVAECEIRAVAQHSPRLTCVNPALSDVSISVSEPLDDSVGSDSDESIGIFTDAHAERIKQARILPFVQPATTVDTLIQSPKVKRERKTASKKAVDPLFHVIQNWWQDAEHGAGRVIVDFGRAGQDTNRIVKLVRALGWGDNEVVSLLQECFLYWTETGPSKDVEYWSTKMHLGMMPERLEIWWNTIKQKQVRQQQREAHEQRAMRMPVVPRRQGKVAS